MKYNGFPSTDELDAEIMGFYFPEKVEFDEAALLDLESLKDEISKHHSRNLEDTIDLSFPEAS